MAIMGLVPLSVNKGSTEVQREYLSWRLREEAHSTAPPVWQWLWGRAVGGWHKWPAACVVGWCTSGTQMCSSAWAKHRLMLKVYPLGEPPPQALWSFDLSDKNTPLSRRDALHPPCRSCEGQGMLPQPWSMQPRCLLPNACPTQMSIFTRTHTKKCTSCPLRFGT